MVAPTVMPSSRAMASMPPAAPERARGAAASIARLFGAWKKPKPRPQSAMRQAMSNVSASAGRSAISAEPDGEKRHAEGAEHARRDRGRRAGPRCGAASPSATGQGVIRRPVSTWSRPSALWKWKGSATKATEKATKAQIEA